MNWTARGEREQRERGGGGGGRGGETGREGGGGTVKQQSVSISPYFVIVDIPQTLDRSILHVPPALSSTHQDLAPPLSCPLQPTLSLLEAHTLPLLKIVHYTNEINE